MTLKIMNNVSFKLRQQPSGGNDTKLELKKNVPQKASSKQPHYTHLFSSVHASL